VLRDGGIDPEVVVSGVDEDVDTADPARAVAVLAERKASAVAGSRPGSLVLGCDSLLEADGRALGKPAGPRQAVDLWRVLSGGTGVLHSGHCLIDTGTGRQVVAVASTVVRFGTPSDDEVAAYVASGEPLHLAGGFSIDGLGAPFVEGIDGDPTNVLGLSMPLLRSMLAELGVAITSLWSGTGSPTVRPAGDADGPWIAEFVARTWGLPVVSVSGVHDPTRLPGFVAEVDGERVGALTYHRGDDGIEVVTLDSLAGGRGVGSALLAAAHDAAGAEGRRLWLITTDDNARAVAFYLRRGMEMVAVHRDFVDEVRRSKPSVTVGADGAVAFRHALQFEFPAGADRRR
jgi:septum formation protein